MTVDSRLKALVATCDIILAALAGLIVAPDNPFIGTVVSGYLINLLNQHVLFLPATFEDLSNTGRTLVGFFKTFFTKS